VLLQGPGPANELLAHHERASIEIRREHMRCLKETEWLNDEVINMYVAMLQVRDGCVTFVIECSQ
jgi:Ulp1 family protease